MRRQNTFPFKDKQVTYIASSCSEAWINLAQRKERWAAAENQGQLSVLRLSQPIGRNATGWKCLGPGSHAEPVLWQDWPWALRLQDTLGKNRKTRKSTDKVYSSQVLEGTQAHLEQISNYSKLAGNKFNIENSIVFLYISNEQENLK